MTSVDLRAELKCSICKNIYKDPVMLHCGHSFCRVCIDRMLDTQKDSGDYFCPICRKRSKSRPVLQKNIALHIIAQRYQKESEVFCTYCVDSPVPAVKACLLCDAYLCDKHLTAHNKAPEHVLSDPITSLQTRKCPTHKELIQYYCIEDGSCILEMIWYLEIKKEELSRKIHHIQELCNMADPLTVLQEPDTGDLCDTEDGDDEDRERHDKLLHDGGGLDVAGILHTGLSDIITEVNVHFYIQEAADILLDVNTAHNNLHISEDRKTATRSDIDQNRPETPERFHACVQVLSSRSFSSGRHYWEVDVGGSDSWRVGMCYPSIDRGGEESQIGCNNQSWGLYRSGNHYKVIHGSKRISLPHLSSNRVRIYLDYEAGRISFYDLFGSIRHLHTFTTTFTEPLHPVLGLGRGCINICGGKS
ncbi:nuclear factor 7, ovary-like [Mantella aurantiaca]